MKNQYFGDINDYRKYGLLRVLSAVGRISTGVCWLLTPSDGRTDGQSLTYLDQPLRYRHFDPYLFDHLFRCLKVEGERDVRFVEGTDILPGTSFYEPILSDSANERCRYFAEMLENFRGVDLVFFDPDNGLEVPSKRFGRKNSSKYLYWDELKEAYSVGHSVLVYQHFVREERNSFVMRIVDETKIRLGAAEIYAFRTLHVVFLLVSQSAHTEHFSCQAEHVSHAWRGQTEVYRYPRD